MMRRLSRRQLLVDVLLPVAVLGVFLLPAIGYSGLEPFVLLGFCVALIFRRLCTLGSLGVAWFTAIAEMLLGVDPVGPSNILIVIVLYSTGAHSERLVRWLGFGSAFLGAGLVSLYVVVIPTLGTGLPGVGTVFSAAFILSAALAGFLLSWTVGFLVRVGSRGRESRAAAARAEQEVAAEQERTRIARDMHDVVAHSLAVVIAQADGARYLRTTDPEAVNEALTAIASTAREALADVRVLLGQLRYDQGQGPQPALADLERLYEQFRASGLDLRVEAAGSPLAVGTSMQLAVYRIVQESLTNALRHGRPGERVQVRFDWTPGGVHLAVSNPPGEAREHRAAGGHGLAGMTERAALVGGRLTAADEGDRFTVRAWLPVERPPLALPAPSAVPAVGAP
ncbi:MAG: sensor histidine kinase [Micrococcales bacterium]|nr:sensor histidine kinase [Micrococcales bacterium]